MQKQIGEVLEYFSAFSYVPSLEEIHTFLSIKVAKEKLRQEFEKYTYPQYSKFLKKKVERKRYSLKKIKKISLFLKLISLFPSIKLIGLSGSMAMMNAKEGDDIDIFVITAKDRLWAGRLICLAIAELLGLRRKRRERRAKDKVCLNLFFDEKELEVPDNKKTKYIAHEILQMKPMINKDQIYERFLSANRWVVKIFPNAFMGKIRSKKGILKSGERKKLFDLFENSLKRIQLKSINKHKTNEIISDTQLWFFPNDFEKRIEG
jgi:predicted nucleotidyltransferase